MTTTKPCEFVTHRLHGGSREQRKQGGRALTFRHDDEVVPPRRRRLRAPLPLPPVAVDAHDDQQRGQCQEEPGDGDADDDHLVLHVAA
jgi:hypothetical protein